MGRERRGLLSLFCILVLLAVISACVPESTLLDKNRIGAAVTPLPYSYAERVFPENPVENGSNVSVRIDIFNLDNDTIYVLEETYNDSFLLLNNGSGDTTEDGKLKWLYFDQATPYPDQSLLYILRAPQTPGNYSFSGIYQMEYTPSGTSEPIEAEFPFLEVVVPPPSPPSYVERSYSVNPVEAGNQFTVTLTVEILDGDTFYAIDETVPAGFTLIDPGTADTQTPGHLKWVVTSEANSTNYSYILQAPNTTGEYVFIGEYQFEYTPGGTPQPIQSIDPYLTVSSPSQLCNNGVQEDPEECDQTDLDGQSCTSLGYDGGTLACTASCTFDTANCINYGVLTANAVTDDRNVNKDQLFTFSSTVTCTGGTCGTVQATLDPFECGTACSSNYGCTGTSLRPECSLSSPADYHCDGTNSVYNIYVNTTSGQNATIGESLNVTVEYACWPDSGDEITIWYWDTQTWQRIGYWQEVLGEINNLGECDTDSANGPDGNKSAVFTVAPHAGTHIIRALENDQPTQWDQETTYCPSPFVSGTQDPYGDYDDIQFFVSSSGAPQNKGIVSTVAGTLPFYTIDANPQSCGVLTDGETCTTTWQVNATGDSGSYTFFTIYETLTYPGQISQDSSPAVAITINESGTPECTDDSDCDDGLACNGAETCDAGTCQPGTSVDCSAYDIAAVDTCTYVPDGSDFTRDTRTAFTSTCTEPTGTCTPGDGNISHACDLACGAECVVNTDCANQCVGDTFYSSGTCDTGACACSYDQQDCNLQDGWYTTATTQWLSLTQCREYEQVQEEYRDYTCSLSGCTYTVTANRWTDTGSTRNLADGTTCNDGAFCTVDDVCDLGVCGGSSRDCGDGFGCTIDSCDEGANQCVNVNDDNLCSGEAVCRPDLFSGPSGCGVISQCTGQPDGTVCDNGVFCDGPDQCFSQTCTNVGPAINSDDGVACTLDSCDEATDQVVNTPSDAYCDDSQYCNGAEYCDELSGCQSGTPPVLGDGVSCTVDACDEVADTVTHTPDDGYCDDGLYCNGAETCDINTGCLAGTSIDCSGNDVAGIATCFNNPDNNPSTYDYLPSFTSSCDEGADQCTSSTALLSHTCDVATCGAACEIDEDCTNYCSGNIYYFSGTCDTGACACNYNTQDCDASDGWYPTTTYQWGAISQCQEKQQVQEEYRDYTCSLSGCTYTVTANRWTDTGSTRNLADGTSCTDAFTCTTADVCTAGVCGGTPLVCDDGFTCTDDSCVEPSGCQYVENDLNCGPGEICSPSNFPDGIGCGLQVTDCTGIPDGVSCDDGSYCNGADTCQGDSCVNSGTPIDCSYRDLPAVDTCTNSPDDNPSTRDTAPGFTSQCIESSQDCSIGTYTFTHACDLTCGAACTLDADCDDGDVGTIDACLSDCSCTYTLNCTDDDGDGFNSTGGPTCGPVDCQDENPLIKPDATEICDGEDNNCNGFTDTDPLGNPLAQSCYTGPPSTEGVGVCVAGTQTCQDGAYGVCENEVTPTTEYCEGTLDENCDSFVDEYCTANVTVGLDSPPDGAVLNSITQDFTFSARSQSPFTNYTIYFSAYNATDSTWHDIGMLGGTLGGVNETTMTRTFTFSDHEPSLSYGWNVQVCDPYGCAYAPQNSSFTIDISYLMAGTPVQLTDPVVDDPAGVLIEQPFTRQVSSGLVQVNVSLASWSDISSVDAYEDGVVKTVSFDVGTGTASWLANLSAENISLVFTVPSPAYEQGQELSNYTSGPGINISVYVHWFNITSTNSLTGISAAIPVPLGYGDWQLVRYDTGDAYAHNTYNLSIENATAYFNGFQAGIAEFALAGYGSYSATTNLTVYDTSDTNTVWVNQPFTFYAVYYNVTDNASINRSNGTEVWMAENETITLYNHSITLEYVGRDAVTLGVDGDYRTINEFVVESYNTTDNLDVMLARRGMVYDPAHEDGKALLVVGYDLAGNGEDVLCLLTYDGMTYTMQFQEGEYRLHDFTISSKSRELFQVSCSAPYHDTVVKTDTVFIRPLCGDGVCDSDFLEDADSCSADCGGDDDGRPSSGSPGGAPPVYRIYETVFNFTEDLYQATITYNSTSPMQAGIDAITKGPSATDLPIHYESYNLTGTKPIMDAEVHFRVDSDWITDNLVDPYTVTLFQMDESWKDKGARLISEDSDYFYYRTTITLLNRALAIGGFEQEATEQQEEQGDEQQDIAPEIIENPFPTVMEEDERGFEFLYGVAAILFLISALVSFFYGRAHRHLAHEKADMYADKYQELTSYIQKCRDKGRSDAEIKQALRGVGWKEDIVDDFLQAS